MAEHGSILNLEDGISMKVLLVNPGRGWRSTRRRLKRTIKKEDKLFEVVSNASVDGGDDGLDLQGTVFLQRANYEITDRKFQKSHPLGQCHKGH